MNLFDSLLTYWPFTLAGAGIFGYTLYLVHRKIDIGVGHAILIIAAILVALAPFISVKVGTDGSLELQRLAVINQATQDTVVGVSELQMRLDNLASETERRLAALENSGKATDPSSALPAIVNPPNEEFPALNNPKAIIDALQGWDPTKPYSGRLPN